MAGAALGNDTKSSIDRWRESVKTMPTKKSFAALTASLALTLCLYSCGQPASGDSNGTVASVSDNEAANPEDSSGSLAVGNDSQTMQPYTGEWLPVDASPNYDEGTVLSIAENPDGTIALRLDLTRYYMPYSAKTEPSQSGSYENGTVSDYILRQAPVEPLSIGENVIVWTVGMITKDNPTKFAGAIIVYYEADGTYYDQSGKAAAMPPIEYLGYDIFNK